MKKLTQEARRGLWLRVIEPWLDTIQARANRPDTYARTLTGARRMILPEIRADFSVEQTRKDVMKFVLAPATPKRAILDLIMYFLVEINQDERDLGVNFAQALADFDLGFELEGNELRPTAPWHEGWDLVRSLGGGGHGRTAVVRRVGDDDGPECVVKVLKQPTDPERRARLQREVVALRNVSDPGIPKLVDTNCDGASDDDELFCVMEFIRGSTVEDTVKKHGPVSIDQALICTMALVKIVEVCHEHGLVHRDIKPDNIVLRNDDLTHPVLIDFGLSVQIDEQGMLTATEQDVGNRFLSLPEHHSPGDDKRDPRADLTMCVAILFYLVTGRRPGTLEDGAARMPHERSDVRERLATIPDRQLVALTRLFNASFAKRVTDRVQTADDLLVLLAAVHHGEDSGTSTLSGRRSIARRVGRACPARSRISRTSWPPSPAEPVDSMRPADGSTSGTPKPRPMGSGRRRSRCSSRRSGRRAADHCVAAIGREEIPAYNLALHRASDPVRSKGGIARSSVHRAISERTMRFARGPRRDVAHW
jgi:serine/threonine protein kinase